MRQRRAGMVAMATALIVLIDIGASDRAGAVSLTLSPARAEVASPGDDANLCVGLRSGGALIAGIQNDLSWDGNCLTLVGCDKTGRKPLAANILPNTHFTLRALVLSLGNLDPMADGPMYCCKFRFEGMQPGSCCPIQLTNARASDPDGQGFLIGNQQAHMCLRRGFPMSSVSPTPTPTPPPGDPAADDGCSIQRGRRKPAGLGLSILLAPALIVLRRRLRRTVPACSVGPCRSNATRA